MKFIINSALLHKKLTIVGKVINNKCTLPILECFKLGIRDSRLYIAGSDIENRISTSLEVISEGHNGELAIGKEMLLSALKELPEQPITFEVNLDNLAVTITYLNGKYEFVGTNASEFPTPKPFGTDYDTLSLNSQVLLSSLNSTSFASGNDELRPVMSSVYFDIKQDNTTFVASDGHKLVRLENKLVRASEKTSFILPSKSVNLLKMLIGKFDDDIKVKFDINNAEIAVDDYKLFVRFIEGRYPNYNAVIPDDDSNVARLPKDTLLAMVKRVSVYANKSSKLVKFDLSENELAISSQDIDYSTSAEEKCSIDYHGTPMQIGFKGTFLIELLESIQSEDVIIKLSDSSRAGLFLPSENEDGMKYTGLLMPMLISGSHF